jgi:hypothetical protein
MCIGLRYFFVIFLTIVIVSDTAAQKNVVYKTMQRYKGTDSKSRLMRMGVDKFMAESLVDLGYDDSTIVKLRTIGVDLPGLSSKEGKLDEKEKGALSDCIVIGTVARIEHPKGNIPYQTIAFVDAEEFLRNDYHVSKSQIPVMIVSGPTRTMIPEDTLGLGEHVVLFLSARSLIVFAHHNLPAYYSQLINDSTIGFRILGEGKYRIESGKVFRGGYQKSLTQVKDEIKTVLKVLPHFVVTNE